MQQIHKPNYTLLHTICTLPYFLAKKRDSAKSLNPFSLLLAGPTRLELATSGVTGRRSNQTELRPRVLQLNRQYTSDVALVNGNWLRSRGPARPIRGGVFRRPGRRSPPSG